jgi:hypothetical protein
MGGRAARRLGIAILVILALLLIADRVGAVIAEDQAGDTIKSSQHLKSRPDVNIAGFPFLTQLASGDYDEISITAKHVPLTRAARFLQLTRITVVLHSLNVSRDFSDFHAKTATATALISFADLGKALGVPISYAGDGQITVGKLLRVRPQLTGDGLSFNGGSLSSLSLQGIPFNIRVQTLKVTKDGLVIALSGSNLEYHS